MGNYDERLFVDREKKFRGFQKLLQTTTQQTIMLIEAPQDMGKTWLAGKMESHCRGSETNIPVAYVDFRNPRLIHEIQDQLGLIRFIRDSLGHADHFRNLNVTINSFTEAAAGRSTGLATLRQNIELHFNLDELKELAFDLEINFENLAGETLRAKSRELINYCQRHNMLRRLVELCASLREEVDWWAGLEELRREAAETPAGAEEAIAAADNNAPIWADSDMERKRAEQQINDAFFECLTSLLGEKGQIALLFDSFELAPPEVVRWLHDELLPRLRDGELERTTVIITGRKTPDLADLNIKHLIVQTDLEAFTEEHVREYFEERRGITGLDIRTIVLTSGGAPGKLALQADQAMATSEGDDDFFKDL